MIGDDSPSQSSNKVGAASDVLIIFQHYFSLANDSFACKHCTGLRSYPISTRTTSSLVAVGDTSAETALYRDLGESAPIHKSKCFA